MTDRFNKWLGKLDGDTQKETFNALKPHMVELESAATKDLVAIEQQVKQIVGNAPLIHLPYYIIFGKEIYKRKKKFSHWTLINEIEILEEKWRARGLNYLLLEAIKEFFVEGYKYNKHFHLDISLLDGGHIL